MVVVFGYAIPLTAILIGLGLIVLAVIVIKILKNILVNTALGVLALLAVNFFSKELGFAFTIPLTLVTGLVAAVLGLAGVGLLILLKLFGINIS